MSLGLQRDVWQLEAPDTVRVALPIVVELSKDIRLDNRVVFGEHTEKLEGCVCITSDVLLLQ